jgi:protein TonB
MIRHSSSLLLSVILHLLLVIAIYFIYTQVSKEPTPHKIARIKIELCNVPLQEVVTKNEEVNRDKETPPAKPKVEKIEKVEKKELEEVVKTVKKVEKQTPKIPPKKETKPKPIKKEPIKEKEIILNKPLPSPELKQEVKEEPKQELQKRVFSKEKQIIFAPESIEEVLPPEIETIPYEEIHKPSPQTLTTNYINKHIAIIQELLAENLYYPRSARRRGIIGDVKIKFELLPDSSVQNIEVLESSHEILSRAAIKTIQELESKFPQPNEKLSITLPVNFSLK